jgi:hypothetical protein
MILSGNPITEYLLTGYTEELPNIITAQAIGSLDGQEVIGSRLDPRTMELSGFFNVYRNKRQMTQTMRSVFNASAKQAGVLVYENRRSNSRYFINCRPEELPSIQFDGAEVRFTIPLIAHDPFWRTAGQVINLTKGVKMGRFPLVIPHGKFVFGARARILSGRFNNIGDAATGAKYTFKAAKGTVTNPSITHEATGATIKVIYKMEKGDEVVVISERDYTDVFINGERGTKYLTDEHNRQFFLVEQGANVIQFDADENVTNLTIRAEYDPLFLGVL